MSKLTGNKGEWSEIYVLLRLLEIGRLYAADENLNKLHTIFFEVLKIIREESSLNLEFIVNTEEKTIAIADVKNNKVLSFMKQSEFKQEADNLYNEIVSTKGASFSINKTEDFLKRINIFSLKAKSSDKTDIKIKLHDIYTGFEAIQGFSIKSRLGNPSTLVNAGKTTNFIYEISGNINDKIMKIFNETGDKFTEKFKLLKENNCNIFYSDMENEIFKTNLILIDGDLPKIISELLKLYYIEGYSSISSAIKKITTLNPIGYNLKNNHPFYQYKFKAFLKESALGMFPSKVWTGKTDATGGYIIVREDGEILCYHLFNMNEFEDYLISNTKFETASTTRHDFGYIYKNNNKYYIKLNLQVRFIK